MMLRPPYRNRWGALLKKGQDLWEKGPGVAARWLPYLAAVLTLLGLWQLFATLFPSYLMPRLGEVFSRLAVEIRKPAFQMAVMRSLYRLGIGFSLACALGLAVGLVSGISRILRGYFRALISILQSVPPIAWVPLLIILLGFGDPPILVVITIAAFFPMALAVMNATENVEETHLHVARLMGASRFQLISKVYAPAVLPAVITGAQVSFGNAWRSLIAAEMVGGVNTGLGWSITFAGEVADMAGVLLGITVIGIMAALIDRLVIEQVKRRLLRWRYTL